MTPKQILDSFSETLIQDARILSAQERSLVATLLQHAKNASAGNPELREAVRNLISSAIGETVAQRAFAVLGGSIVERIVESSALAEPSTALDSFSKGKERSNRGVLSVPAPPPPSPSPSPGPQTPGTTPILPPSPGPQTPGTHIVSTAGEANTAVLERPAKLAAKCVVLDEFLAPQELAELTRFTLAHEKDFQTSEVISPSAESGIVDYDHRRSQVLMELGPHQERMLSRIKSVLPQVLKQLDMPEFTIRSVEAQITASNDGDFFHFHSDNGNEPVATRHLTFVYFFHREPRQFQGGELRIHDARLEAGNYVSEGTYQAIVPEQNQIVFFPCELMHEISRVKCASGMFADSRFTLNGWLRQ